ncbi:MAG: mannosyltransferase [Cyanobacteria bacterium P01_A01_bin.123]
MELKIPRKHLLISILLLGFLLRVGLGFALPNILLADEIFQTQEQAHRLAFGYGITPWEFREGIRSWIFPTVLAIVMRLSDWVLPGSVDYLFAINVLLSALSLTCIWVSFQWAKRVSGVNAGFIAAIASCIWFELIFFAPKAFTEVVATHVLLPGFYLGLHNADYKGFPDERRLFWAGVLLGIAFSLRFHFLPGILVCLVAIGKGDFRKRWLPLLIGFIGPVLIFGAVDALTWDYPFQSMLKNFWINVVEEKSLEFGILPWYGYLKFLIRVWSWAIIPMAGLTLIGSLKSPQLALFSLVILGSHSLLSHKEYRFIYPVIVCSLILASIGLAELLERLKQHNTWVRRYPSTALVIGLILCLATSTVLATRFETRDADRLGFPEILIYRPSQTHWTTDANMLISLKILSQTDDICGLGLWNATWLYGGYTHLHQDITVVTDLKHNQTRFDARNAEFNYVIADNAIVDEAFIARHGNYRLQTCFGNTCILKRPGECRKFK